MELVSKLELMYSSELVSCWNLNWKTMTVVGQFFDHESFRIVPICTGRYVLVDTEWHVTFRLLLVWLGFWKWRWIGCWRYQKRRNDWIFLYLLHSHFHDISYCSVSPIYLYTTLYMKGFQNGPKFFNQRFALWRQHLTACRAYNVGLLIPQ